MTILTNALAIPGWISNSARAKNSQIKNSFLKAGVYLPNALAAISLATLNSVAPSLFLAAESIVCGTFGIFFDFFFVF